MDVLQGISGISTAQAAASTADAETKKLGRDDFLTMFLAQLKNQDPLNPMESAEFSSQLAQFSSVEQLFNVNENLQSLMASQGDSSRLQALNFIGREIVAEGDSLSLEAGKAAAGRFELDDAAECTVRILNEEGVTVRTIPLGYLAAGAQSFEWDGLDGSGNAMEPGVYTFQISALTESGALVTASTSISGTVTGVDLEGDAVSLYVGAIPVAIGDIQNVRTPSSAATGETQ
ncbi:MAG: flagellar hook capping FlgD N-terminal domain-containing protein [Thermodesulfobacteriota bacterium]